MPCGERIWVLVPAVCGGAQACGQCPKPGVPLSTWIDKGIKTYIVRGELIALLNFWPAQQTRLRLVCAFAQFEQPTLAAVQRRMGPSAHDVCSSASEAEPWTSAEPTNAAALFS